MTLFRHAGHNAVRVTVTMFSSAIDSAALPGELVRDRMTTATVSTPQRLKSGRIIEARYAAGMLLVGIAVLNENDDNATRLATGGVL